MIYREYVPVVVTGYGYLKSVPDMATAPSTLNVHPFHGGTEGVGLAFTSLMTRYLNAVMRQLGVTQRRELSEWWESDYGINRVRASLNKAYSHGKAAKILDMVLICAREEADPVDVALDNYQSVAWLTRKIALCQWLADKRSDQPYTFTYRWH